MPLKFCDVTGIGQLCHVKFECKLSSTKSSVSTASSMFVDSSCFEKLEVVKRSTTEVSQIIRGRSLALELLCLLFLTDINRPQINRTE